MIRRPAAETIAILRRTLEQIERDLDPIVDAVPLEELKRVVVHRIAELEAERLLEIAKATPVTPILPAPAGEALDSEETAA